MTFRQAKELNANVKQGSKGSLVVYADRIAKTETSDDGEKNERDIYFMKGYTVFNIEQIEGLPDHFYAVTAPQLDPVQRNEAAELFFANTAADIRHGGNRAYYAAEPDYVEIPPFVSFADAESYCSTLAHELTHGTKHPSRLERDFGRRKFGDEGYARELDRTRTATPDRSRSIKVTIAGATSACPSAALRAEILHSPWR